MDNRRNNQSVSREDNQNQQQDKKKGNNVRSKQDAKRLLLEEVDKAKKILIQGKAQDAFNVVLKAVSQYKEDLGGESSILLLPAYFILAEAQIQLPQQNLKRAEEYLTAAYWNWLKYYKEDEGGEDQDNENEQKKDKEDISEEEKLTYKCTLHKTFSKLFLAQKEYARAIDDLKNGILLDSLRYGPDHIATSLNYYQMGNIFIQMKEYFKGEAYYAKTSEIWYKHFKNYQRNMENYQEGTGQEPVEEPDDMIVTEGFDILHHILVYFEEKYQDEEKRLVHQPILNTYRALAWIFKYVKQEDKYTEFIHHAFYECRKWKGEEHRKTQRLQELIQQAGEIIQQDEDEEQQQQE